MHQAHPKRWAGVQKAQQQQQQQQRQSVLLGAHGFPGSPGLIAPLTHCVCWPRLPMCVLHVQAAAALAVGVGSFSDPQQLQGLAHYLEHMLFMGSEKYPDENEYDAFLNKHGGGSNAYTELVSSSPWQGDSARHGGGRSDNGLGCNRWWE